ncbi:hypothetical protein, partial [Streptomyces sp. NPDC048473]
AVNPFLDGVVVFLTGMHVPRGSSVRMRAEVEIPHSDLMKALDEFQDLIGQIAKSVSGAGSGQWNDAYVKAMSTFGAGAGADYVKNLKDTAGRISNYARETGYQIDYTNRMIIVQVVQFLFEWALTLILAIFNPIAAVVEQTFLRALYRLILRSFLLRLLATIGMFEALNVGLGAAMDIFVRWSLASEGKYTENGGQYLRQAVAFGAVQGAFMVFVPYAGSALAGLISKAIGRDVVGNIDSLVGRALSGGGRDTVRDLGRETVRDLGRDLSREGGDDLGSGPVGGVGVRGGFGRDIGVTAASMAQRFEMGEVSRSVRGGFSADVGNIFARDLGGAMGVGGARELGEKWAGAFLTRFGKKDFGDTLFRSLDDLPRGMGGELRSALSHGVAGALSTDWGRKFSGYLGDAIANAAHQNFSEGVYSLFTTGKFTTSWETGLSGGGAGLVGHMLTRNAVGLGGVIGDKFGLQDKFGSLLSGLVNPASGPGDRLHDLKASFRFAGTSGQGGRSTEGLLGQGSGGGGDLFGDTGSVRSFESTVVGSGFSGLSEDSSDTTFSDTTFSDTGFFDDRVFSGTSSVGTGFSDRGDGTAAVGGQQFNTGQNPTQNQNPSHGEGRDRDRDRGQGLG